MKKVVIAPDSFKGSLSSPEVCEIIAQVLREKYGDIEIISIPMSDGGEGLTDCFVRCFDNSERQLVTVSSPLMGKVCAGYAILHPYTAVMEMSAASGITIEKKNEAMRASTYGTGEMIKDALNKGVRRLFIGIGGSATTDGGIGCIGALGGKFLDEKGDIVPLCGEGLKRIKAIDLSALDPRIKECEITVLCDVKNPLYGEKGAAYIYAPQKGANDTQVARLDEGLRNLGEVAKKHLGVDYALLEGAGAAGGLGFALVAFLGARLQGGIDTMLKLTDLENKTYGADLVITGEGKMDEQSLMGKVSFGVAAKSMGKKTIAIVGLNTADYDKIKAAGISEVIETNPEHLPFELIKDKAKEDLAAAAEKITL